MDLQVVGEVGLQILTGKAPLGERIGVPTEAPLWVFGEPALHALLGPIRPVPAQPPIHLLDLSERIGDEVVVVEVIDVVGPFPRQFQRSAGVQAELNWKAALHVGQVDVFLKDGPRMEKDEAVAAYGSRCVHITRASGKVLKIQGMNTESEGIFSTQRPGLVVCRIWNTR